ncbi:hypothetical protein [Pseudomonas fluorescens]|uniref:hypothetical protein n=1 Tax=Pseudomonas fluorescens TaxID=294 RepID=UPI000732194E|nr:hypothetical protein [Pseudomonas fluorescens]
MSIIRAPRPEGNFYLLNKGISEDARLSWAARGLLIFLLGKPDHWEISVAHLRGETAKSSKPTGRDGVYGLLQELISAGYVHRSQDRSDTGVLGEIHYLVSESPLPAQPYTDSPETAQPYTANPTLVSIEGKQGLNEAARTEKPSCKSDPLEGFEQFWKLYPNGKGKQEAAAAWKKLKPDADLRNVLKTALAQHSASRDWTKDDGQYVPMASTWLNKKRYLDELKPAMPSKQSAYTGLPNHTLEYPEVAHGSNF